MRFVHPADSAAESAPRAGRHRYRQRVRILAGALAFCLTTRAAAQSLSPLVLVETGLSGSLVGKRLMSATFVTDFATVAALTILFITPTVPHFDAA